MLGKVVLWVSAVVFISYGIACFFSPGLPAGLAGLQIINGDGYAEMGAMYGGLQMGVGVFCLLGATQDSYYRPALALLVISIGLLATGRLYSTLTGSDPVGAYTWGAISYEFATAILAAIALRKD